ncbi:MAG: bifunctional tetrahydrofolate synthase/dihydrofolate synthase [Pseudomonadota bacterium]
MVRFQELSDWLQWQQQLHPKSIDLGLQRVSRVAKNLGLLKPATSISQAFSGPLNADATVITVAGTNGKGSCLKTIEQCLITQQLTVGVYTSPHLHHYCERICINGAPVSEPAACKAFAEIDKARGDISLSYFEFGTLAALWLFVQHRVDFILLEVGLGGRLDAVNIVDADIMAVTSIGIDHQAWLGSDRNLISREKLGIARSSRPLFIAETQLTPALKRASNLYPVKQINRDFYFSKITQDSWQYSEINYKLTLPVPNLPPTSVAAGLAILSHLDLLPEDDTLSAVVSALALPGRFQQVSVEQKTVIFDVAHNVAAAQLLAERLSADGFRSSADVSCLSADGSCLSADGSFLSADGSFLSADGSNGVVRAVVAMLDDKEHTKIIDTLSHCIQIWYLGDLSNVPRALPAKQLMEFFYQADLADKPAVYIENTVENAFNAALSESNEHDRIVVFGSFFTVAAIQSHLENER